MSGTGLLAASVHPAEARSQGTPMKPLATILTVLAGSLALAVPARANPEVYEQTLRSAV